MIASTPTVSFRSAACLVCMLLLLPALPVHGADGSPPATSTSFGKTLDSWIGWLTGLVAGLLGQSPLAADLPPAEAGTDIEPGG